MASKAFGCCLILALALGMFTSYAAAAEAPGRSLRQTTNPLGLGSNLQKVQNSTLQYIQTVAPNVANLFGNSLALTTLTDPITSTGTTSGTSFINGVAANFQDLLAQQTKYYQNLQTSLKSNNGTFAQRTVCDLGALYQAVPSLFATSGTTGTSALSTLLNDNAYAKLFNKECQNVDPAYGSLAPTVAHLLGNGTIAQEVQTLISKTPASTAAGTTTSRANVPSYLQNTAVGNYLQAIQQTTTASTSSSGTQGLGAKLVNSYFQALGSSLTPTAPAAASAPVVSAVLKAFGAGTGAAAASPIASGQLASQITKLIQSATGPGK